MSELEFTSSNLSDVDPYPTKEDLCRTVHDIHPNKIEGGYKNALEYLNNHFHLLREDFIRPLRDGVDAFRNPVRGDPRQKAFRIYYNIYLEKPRLEKDGWIAKAVQKGQSCNENLRFDLRKGSHAKKSLIYGTLLCLSNDNFDKNIYMAVVHSAYDNESYEAGEVEDIDDCEVDEVCQFTIRFTEKSLNSFLDGTHGNKVFTALEPTAYFESYYHTLTGLQNLAKLRSLPMEQYIVRCDTKCELPEHMKNVVNNFLFCNKTNSFMSTEDIRRCAHPVRVAKLLEMNPSQFEAYIAALTQKFSVIQGPPGTGKTYIGLCIVRTLLLNLYGFIPGKRQVLDKPILVVCYTNHALDQFLEGILNFLKTSDLIRIGSRSKSKKLEECNINLRSTKLHKEIRKAKSDLNHWKQKKSAEAIDILEFLEPGKRTILYHTLDYFITNPAHKKQLHVIGTEFINKHGYPEEYRKYATWVWLEQVNCADDITLDREKVVKSYRRHYLNRMTEKEAEKVVDIRSLDLKDRWRLYLFYLYQYERLIKTTYKRYLSHYLQCDERLKEISDFKKSEILKKAKIIGMTTTGAARYQTALERLQPPIVIVEEAAEVLEAHLLTSISSGCQHLILIGDHKQLRPCTSDYEIGTDYKLEISLFERMVLNGFPVRTLNIQHRMRPEVSALVRHIYGKLDDHQSVIGRKNIRGLKTPVLLFNHSAKESSRANSTSKSNKFEADMICQLVKFLTIEKKYEAGQITVISMYSEQLFLLKNLLGQEVLVTTVDNYQGEENDIIILSTVRNNDRNDLGFVAIENRICVALSRAKHGLFAFGNFTMLSSNSALWKKVVESADTMGMVGDRFLLSCEVHGETASISTPKGFKEKMSTKCTQGCQTRLPCGHLCTKKCHIDVDKDHSVFICEEICGKVLDCKHECQGICSEPCRSCKIPVPFKLSCEHTQYATCGSNIESIKCKAKCSRTMDCGHPCKQKCYKLCDPKLCEELSTTQCIRCGAPGIVPCNEKENWACTNQCPQTLSCGHPCQGTCQECQSADGGHIQCKQFCEVTRKCHHRCKSKCRDCFISENIRKCEDNPCNERVIKLCEKCSISSRLDCHELENFCCEVDYTEKLPCGHESTQPCYKWSQHHWCDKIVEKCCPRCKQTTKVMCSAPLKCNHLYTGKLPCLHDSRQTCCEWSPDETCSSLIEWPCRICGRKKITKCSGKDVFVCQGQCTIILGCGHQCGGTCKQCFTSGNHEICSHLCGKPLECGHLCKAECYSCQQCENACQSSCYECVEIVEAYCTRCGKINKVKCSEKKKFQCDGPCLGLLICKHMCHSTCSSCSSTKGGSHSSCLEKCQRLLACGHECTGRCFKCSDCVDGCSKNCEMNPCAEIVEKVCARCNEKAEVECGKLEAFSCKINFTDLLPCGHESTQTCGKWTKEAQCEFRVMSPCLLCGKSKPTTCSQRTTFACDEPCNTVLDCGHQCTGTCKICSSTKGGSHSSCPKRCQRLLACGHECTGRCFQCSDCVDGCSKKCMSNSCAEIVEKVCARCNEKAEVECSKLETFSCKRNLTKQLPCDHESTQPCDKWTEDAECESEVMSPCILCGEMKPTTCSQRNTFACDGPCPTILGCDHQCSGSCNSCSKGQHWKCQESCERLTACGHACKSLCHECENCQDKCQSSCFKCEESIEAGCKRCGEVQTVKCFEKDTFTCLKPCRGELACGHQCNSKCSKCPSTIGKSHPPCSEACTKTLKCGHKCTQECSKCSSCVGLCSKKCSECEVLITTPCLYCGTLAGALCKQKDDFLCDNRCNEVLPCEHVCPGSCFKCKDQHWKCEELCGKLLKCGHQCRAKCTKCPSRNGKGSCQACADKCKLVCSHDYKCKNKCGEPCKFTCNNKCSWGCEHNKCEHRCNTPCAHKICERRCRKEVKCQKCQMTSECMGICGEDCPDLCKICDHLYIVEHYKKLDEEYHPSKNEAWVFLKDCRHSFMVKYMDELVKKQFKDKNSYPPVCPMEKCATPILNTGRYIEHTREHQFSLMTNNTDKQNQKRHDSSKGLTVNTPEDNRKSSHKNPSQQNIPAQTFVKQNGGNSGAKTKKTPVAKDFPTSIPTDKVTNGWCTVAPGNSTRENAYYEEPSLRNDVVEEFQHLPPPPPLKNVVLFRDDGFTSQLAEIDKVLNLYIRRN